MPHVTVIGHLRPEGLSVLEGRPDIEVTSLDEGPPESFLDKVARTDAILLRTSKLTAEVIDAAPNLKVVSRHGVGYDNVDIAVLNARRIPLAISASANMYSVAEHAFFMMLELAKAGRQHDSAVREGAWDTRNRVLAVELHGRTLLLLGFGRIGREVARRASAFDMRVEVVDPFVGDATLEAVGAVRAGAFPDALAGADFVSLHLPLNADTRHIIGRRELEEMKTSAVLINTARGGLIDEHALAEALEKGQIRGAGIDVLEAEPPAADHPLLGRDNVLLSPHAAGVTAESMVRMGVEAAENILAVLDGRIDPSVIVNHGEIEA